MLAHNALSILFADGTSILITSHNVHKYQNDYNSAFRQITNWFQANSLFLNLSKTYFMQFSSTSLNSLDINVTQVKIFIPKSNDIKFWGLTINDTLSSKTQVDNILLKLCLACFAM